MSLSPEEIGRLQRWFSQSEPVQRLRRLLFGRRIRRQLMREEASSGHGQTPDAGWVARINRDSDTGPHGPRRGQASS